MATVEAQRVARSIPDLTPTAAAGRVKGAYLWAAGRILLGWVFLWAFLDKAFALGFSTGRNPETGAVDLFGEGAAWLNGGSPTAGVLQYATKGPFKALYGELAGAAWVDWAYMGSMLLIGLALIAGVGVRAAAIGGIAWLILFHTATALPPEHNPIVDDHALYAVVLAGVAYVGAGRYLGLGRWWEGTALVRRFPFLR
ncbi:MAG TPA: hypothetical protein VJN50_08890 [Actinomycetota bacterium]|nr:hypothetical protein [Actinomycetota bacterium]